MNKIKYTLSALVASLALALGVAMPVGATQQEGPRQHSANLSCVDESCNTKTVTIDKSVTLGDCSINGDINQNVDQGQGGAEAENENEIDGHRNDENSQSNGNANASNNQSASNNITLTCTTNNVAAPQVLGSQVEAPKGAVHAGAGGAAVSSAGSIAGLVGSLTAAGAGLVARRKFNS